MPFAHVGLSFSFGQIIRKILLVYMGEQFCFCALYWLVYEIVVGGLTQQ